MYGIQETPAIATTLPSCDRQDYQVIAQAELESYLESQVEVIAPESKRVKTPQRKANYKNKARLRLKDLKETAFREYSCKSSADIKKLLSVMRVKLDLRLTSAWDAIVYELRHELLAAKQIVNVLHPPLTDSVKPNIKVGDRVVWDYPYGWSHLEAWFPLEVMAIEGDKAHLEMMAIPVPIFELSRQK